MYYTTTVTTSVEYFARGIFPAMTAFKIISKCSFTTSKLRFFDLFLPCPKQKLHLAKHSIKVKDELKNMNLRPNREAEPLDVNITPLIDVVFLLLIFFMVTTTFDKQAQLKVTLPEASPSSEQIETESIVLAIDEKGQYYINDKQLVNTTIKTLKQALIKTMNENKDIALILKADAKAQHQAVVTAMDAAAQVGLTRLSIATMDGQ